MAHHLGDLHKLVRNGQNDLLKEKLGKSLNLKINGEGMSLLMLASQNQSWNSLQYLISVGCDVNHMDIYGSSALSLLTQGQWSERKAEITLHLISSGADPNLRKEEGCLSALEASVEYESDGLFRILLDSGAKIGEFRMNGRGLLESLLYRGREKMLEFYFESRPELFDLGEFRDQDLIFHLLASTKNPLFEKLLIELEVKPYYRIKESFWIFDPLGDLRILKLKDRLNVIDICLIYGQMEYLEMLKKYRKIDLSEDWNYMHPIKSVLNSTRINVDKKMTMVKYLIEDVEISEEVFIWCLCHLTKRYSNIVRLLYSNLRRPIRRIDLVKMEDVLRLNVSELFEIIVKSHSSDVSSEELLSEIYSFSVESEFIKIFDLCLFNNVIELGVIDPRRIKEVKLLEVLIKHNYQFSGNIKTYSRFIQHFLICHGIYLSQVRNTTDYITGDEISEIHPENFILLHNGVAWDITNLESYFITTISGDNMYDSHSPWAGETVLSEDDLDNLKNWVNPSAEKIVKYNRNNRFLEVYPTQMIDYLEYFGSHFLGKGELFEKSLIPKLNQYEIDEWTQIKNFVSNNAMPRMSNSISEKIAEIKKINLGVFHHIFYQEMSEKQRYLLEDVNNYLTVSRFEAMFRGEECIMTMGFKMRQAYRRLKL